MKQNPKTKKPFFLKRWTYKFHSWLDGMLFGGKTTDDHASVATPFWTTVVINFWLGMVVIVCSLFMDSGSRDGITTVGAGVGLASVVAVTIWYLIGSLSYFPSIGVKIFRSVYVLAWCSVGFIVGFYSAVIFSFVLIGLFVLMMLYYIVFGDSKTPKSGSSRKKSYDQGNTDYSNQTGKALHERSDGLWHDDEGHAYRKEGNDYYQTY